MIKASINGVVQVESAKSFSMQYPCASNDCYPYEVEISPGKYFIECLGASGSDSRGEYSNGAYTSGIISFPRNITLYFFIGNAGVSNGSPTFNGGGQGTQFGHSGGGATDVRLIGGHFSIFEGLLSRIMVAGGGAGLNTYPTLSENYLMRCGKGNGGGVTGECGYIRYQGLTRNITFPEGGSQSSGGVGSYCAVPPCAYSQSPTKDGKFGIGGDPSLEYGSGGGGGYFGGGGGMVNDGIVASGGGGSSFISGHPECISMDSQSVYDNIIPTQSHVHYSNFSFKEPVMINGYNDIYLHMGLSSYDYMGKGFARIQFIDNDGHICTCISHYTHVHFLQFTIIFLC